MDTLEIQVEMFEFVKARVAPLVLRAVKADATLPEAGVHCYMQGMMDAMQLVDKGLLEGSNANMQKR